MCGCLVSRAGGWISSRIDGAVPCRCPAMPMSASGSLTAQCVTFSAQHRRRRKPTVCARGVRRPTVRGCHSDCRIESGDRWSPRRPRPGRWAARKTGIDWSSIHWWAIGTSIGAHQIPHYLRERETHLKITIEFAGLLIEIGTCLFRLVHWCHNHAVAS